MTGEVTAEVLEKVAKRLGWDSLGTQPAGEPEWRYYRDGHFEGYPCSDGDLLLTILNKAAEMGLTWKLYAKSCQIWNERVTLAYAEAETPLEAAMLAFAQLPESP